ncbi:hypothetical protein [Tessaracoccus flavescens]|nr:hypothetical protein [Tessaracoccus flavescens]
MRLRELFESERRRLTAESVIVLAPEPVDVEPTASMREALGALHLRRIDLADEVRVLSRGGVLGEATRREIAYARERNKPVTFLEPTLDM